MKKTLLASAAAVAMVAGAAIPAQGQTYTNPTATSVEVYAQVDFTKYKNVYVDINKYKDVWIHVNANSTHIGCLVFGYCAFVGKTAAEADAVVNQANVNGHVSGKLNELKVEMDASVSDNAGITQANQDVGYNVNQSNVLSAAVANNAFFADANASVQQTNYGNQVSEIYNWARASIKDSVNDNVGVTMVNQNAGPMNNQANTVALALGVNSTVALAEADLGQFNSNNNFLEFGPDRHAKIDVSVIGNKGVTAVNQSTGAMNNQATTISISGTTRAFGPTSSTLRSGL